MVWISLRPFGLFVCARASEGQSESDSYTCSFNSSPVFSLSMNMTVLNLCLQSFII